jgi:hypothetical protein
MRSLSHRPPEGLEKVLFPKGPDYWIGAVNPASRTGSLNQNDPPSGSSSFTFFLPCVSPSGCVPARPCV